MVNRFVGLILGILPVLIYARTSQTSIEISNRNSFIKRFTDCKEFSNYTIHWTTTDVSRNQSSNLFMISLKCRLDKSISKQFAMEFDVMKCDYNGNLDTCEYFIKHLRRNRVCDNMNKKNTFYTRFMSQFSPPIVGCPVKPGTYVLSKIPMDEEFLKYLPVKDSFWKIRIKGFDKNVLISCVDLDLAITTDAKRG
ncbi:hypothetical protein GWI33_000719 [Rhynchophorus ferrugineus]|uniref:MD-2-related lipid-recognition domain-containing protein n=1 Tax=Rhynchophorus ferrugineus TaxID=354439 RepID=A0A834IP97_RHYFE|nr:hypothetical protein GWI33_000719 [Rhynchophorus ferrugineus]